MRAALYYSNRDIRLEERPVPALGPGEVLLRVQASGICGSDVMEWYRRDRVPLILGHEVAGDVAAVGEGVTHVKVGERVAASHHVPCQTCHHCLSGHETACETLLKKTQFDPGGFCEYLRLGALQTDRGIYPIPEGVSYAEASFAEPLACVLRGQRQAQLELGQSVLVIGSGISGLLHVHLAQASGAGRIVATDVNPYRLAAARRFGAEHVFAAADFSPAALKEVNDGRLADLVILCAGAKSAIAQALGAVERGGTVLFFAGAGEGVTVDLDPNRLFWRTEITLTSSYAGNRHDHLAALELIRGNRMRVGEMITQTFGLADIQKGFALVAAGGESIKVIIEPQR